MKATYILPSIAAFALMLSISTKKLILFLRQKVPTREEAVARFNEAAGNDPIDIENDELDVIRLKDVRQALLFREEFIELVEARAEYIEAILRYRRFPTFVHRRMMFAARAKFAAEWADCQVTLSNIAYVHNLDGEKAFFAKHTSNMTKVVDGKLVKNAAGKVLKPHTYVAPDMIGL